jgi:threonine synthase
VQHWGRVEGKKTMGLEVLEQLDWRLPDVIIYPTGGGTGIIGIWKAFDELEKIDDFFKSIQGQRSTNPADSQKRQTSLDRKMELRQAAREVKSAIQIKSKYVNN